LAKRYFATPKERFSLLNHAFLQAGLPFRTKEFFVIEDKRQFSTKVFAQKKTTRR
jgi:hypothetical protein